ncbi:unnamed protein product [Merluccius merluccius]
MAGLCGLAASLARAPPRLPRFRVLSHRLRCFALGCAPGVRLLWSLWQSRPSSPSTLRKRLSQLQTLFILKRLVAATSHEVSCAAGHVSPVYEAVLRPQMLDVLLSEGFSPEAQPCNDIYDADSPLALVLSYMEDYGDEDDEDLLYSDSVKSLMRAGARLTQDCWRMCLQYLVVFDLLLDERCEAKGKGLGATRLLDGEEVEALQSVAALCIKQADYWLPTLLKSGLDPAALLVPDLLQLRTYVGPDVLMRSDMVSQLPVPSLLHDYLRFDDITPPEP